VHVRVDVCQRLGRRIPQFNHGGTLRPLVPTMPPQAGPKEDPASAP
jgi:hypothetical protein